MVGSYDLQEYAEEGNQDELLIKYAYGWHNTKYGKLFIEQNFGDVKGFFDSLAESLVDMIFCDHTTQSLTNIDNYIYKFVKKGLYKDDLKEVLNNATTVNDNEVEIDVEELRKFDDQFGEFDGWVFLNILDEELKKNGVKTSFTDNKDKYIVKFN